MPTITLNDGTIYNCLFCGLASVGILYLDIPVATLAEALEIFSDKNNSKHLVYKTPEEKIVYDNFIKVIGVEWAYNDSSAVRVALRRPYEGEEV